MTRRKGETVTTKRIADINVLKSDKNYLNVN